MPRRSHLLSSLAMALLALAMGCDAPEPVPLAGTSPGSGSVTSLSSSPGGFGSAQPQATASGASPRPSGSSLYGTVRGSIWRASGTTAVPLLNAEITFGRQTATTLTASASLPDSDGNMVLLQPGEFMLTQVPIGTQFLYARYDDQAASCSVTVAGPGMVTVASESLKITGLQPPVAAGSTALDLVSRSLGSAQQLEVGLASDSQSLAFTPENVSVRLKAPPGGAGDVVRYYRFTYYHSDGSAMAALGPIKLLNEFTVPSAPDLIHSGSAVDLSLKIKNPAPALAQAWLLEDPYAELRIELLGEKSPEQPVRDRAGSPLVVTVPCLRVQ